MLWTEKYRPSTLKEIVTASRIIKDIRNWAEQWNEGIPEKKALVLEGKPGIGKTTTALALAKEYGWDVIEFNASDARNEDVISHIVKLGAQYETFTNTGEFISSKKQRRKLILLDEADNLYEKRLKNNIPGKESEKDLGDIGGKKAIVEVIKITKQPIILTVNDPYKLFRRGYGVALKKQVQEIKFRGVRATQVTALLAKICRNEGIIVNVEVLKQIANKNDGDIRSSINDLQIIAMGKKYITTADLAALGDRDREQNIYYAMVALLSKKISFKTAIEELRKLDEQPESIRNWLDENLPLEYTNPEDLNQGMQYLSEADLLLQRAKSRQYYKLWSYALDLMAATAIAKKEKYTVHTRYRGPSYIKTLSKTKSSRHFNAKLYMKLAKYFHISSKRVPDLVLDDFKRIFQHDPEFRQKISVELKLTRDEIESLKVL